MGGKQKQAQRTKGNQKPSSSARAAEQLAASGVTESGFIGFGALSGDLGYVPTSQGSDETDVSVDPDFRMVLRKFSKRDSTTKLKALQEFGDLCKEKDVEAVKGVLPYWPRLYSKMAIDNDRRVREATQQAFEQLVLRVRRNLAPHLKSIMGSWLLAQCDVYAPAASAARAAFQNAFPPAKQTEAIAFCKETIINHIEENLVMHTAATLSDPKTTEPDDIESKYQKTITSSLLAWKMLMETIPQEQQETLHAKYTSILVQGKFWKHQKSPSSMVRGAFYSLIATLCQTNASIANNFSTKLCPAILHNLDDTDPLTSKPLWEATLYVVTTIEECWAKVNPRKAVFPKLWSVLRDGGSGSAVVIYPNLLPLVGKIPAEIIGDDVSFYKEFFDSLNKGLSQAKVAASPSECESIVKALMECLRFFMINPIGTGSNHAVIQDFILEEQLLPMVYSSILESSSTLARSHFYQLVADLILYLNRLNEKSTSPREEMERVLKTFWRSISSFYTEHTETVHTKNAYILDRMTLLLENFMIPSKLKSPSKVKFAVTEEDIVKPKDISYPKKDRIEVVDSSIFSGANRSLLTVICDTCSRCFEICKRSISKPHLNCFTKLLSVYASEETLNILFTKQSGNIKQGTNAILPYTTQVLLPWCDRSYTESAAGEETLKAFVPTLIAIYNICNDQEKLDFLTLICRADIHVAFTHAVVEKVLAIDEDKRVRKWFKGQTFGSKVIHVTDDLCEKSLHHGTSPEEDYDLQAHWLLLNLALSTDENFEPLVGMEYVDNVLSKIKTALPTSKTHQDLSKEEIERCVGFVCEVANNFFSHVKGCLMLQSAEDLVFALFEISCHQDVSLTQGVKKRVKKAWEVGMDCLLSKKGGFLNDDGFLFKAVESIKERVINGANTMAKLQHLVELAFALCQCMANAFGNADDDDEEDVISVWDHPSVQELVNILNIHKISKDVSGWQIGPMAGSTLTFPSFPQKISPCDINTIPKCVAVVAFNTQLLAEMKVSQVIVGKHGSQDAKASKVETKMELMKDLAWAIALCSAVLYKRRKLLHTSEMMKILQQLEENLAVFMKDLSHERKKVLLEESIQKSLEAGHLNSLALQAILEKMACQKCDVNLQDMTGIHDRLSPMTEPVVHTIQILMPYMTKDEVSLTTELLASMVISCCHDDISSVNSGMGFLAALNKCLEVQDSPVGEGPPSPGITNPDVVLGVMSEIRLWKQQQSGYFIFKRKVDSHTWPVIAFNIEVMTFLGVAIEKIPTKIPNELWDFILCSTVAWTQSCIESKLDCLGSVQTESFCSAACSLLYCVAHTISTMVPVQPELFPENLKTEWEELFSKEAYNIVLPLFMELVGSGKVDLSHPSASEDVVLRMLGLAASQCPIECIKEGILPAKLIAGQNSNLPDHLQSVLNHLCPLLLFNNKPVQIAAYKILLKLMPELASYDIGKEKDEDMDKDVTMTPPEALLSILETSATALEHILGGMSIGENMVIEPYIDEYTLAMAYLLSWKLLLAFFKGAESQLRAEYAVYLRDTNAVHRLIHNVFKLMPENPVITLTDSLLSQPPLQKLSNTKNLFVEEPLLDVTVDSSSVELQHLSCSVYHRTLQDLPAMIRQWWNSQDKKTALIVDRFTSKFVSPILCSQEISALQEEDCKMTNMTVKTRPAAREVVATYKVEELAMELVVSLPLNHPLGIITVECGKRIGVAQNQWRNWMLQMTTFLQHQNGSIMEGLKLWKNNVDKRFEGVDDCMICFSVIHGSNCQLPRLQCKTCKKKFHSACLYKWFNTSNNSSCPMCRNLF